MQYGVQRSRAGSGQTYETHVSDEHARCIAVGTDLDKRAPREGLIHRHEAGHSLRGGIAWAENAIWAMWHCRREGDVKVAREPVPGLHGLQNQRLCCSIVWPCSKHNELQVMMRNALFVQNQAGVGIYSTLQWIMLRARIINTHCDSCVHLKSRRS